MGRASFGTVVAITLALAGCGGDDEPSASPDPRLPPELATAFAAESDQIAASLATGDQCAAHLRAQALRAHIGDAVGSGEVHPSLGREMSAAASSLSDGIRCEPAPQPAPEESPPPEPASAPTGCEQIVAQLSDFRAQSEQAKQQEEVAKGSDKKAAKDLRKQLEDQAGPLIEQFRDQCGGEEGELPGFGAGEDVPPGHGGENPGRGNGRGNGEGGDGD